MHIHFNSHKKSHSHGNKTLDMDQYAVKSGLAFVNPDLKLLMGVLSLFFCLLSKTGITSVIVAIIMVSLILFIGKVRFCEYLHLILIPFTFILLSAIVLLVDISKQKLGFIDIPVFGWYLAITKASLFISARVSIKALCSVTCLYMISLSTPMYEIIAVLRKCKTPEIVIELMYLIYRFIFILLDAYHNMKLSADTRLGYRNLKRSYHSFFGICMNLFVISFQKASKHFNAMEARGYDGSLMFLEEKKQLTKIQIRISAVYVFVILICLVVERIGI